MISIEEFLNKDLKLTLTKDEIEYISEKINYDFHDIERDIREKALIKLCNTDIGSDNTASAIIENYSDLSYEARNALIKLAQNPKSSKNVSGIMQYKFYTLPSEYRNNILENLDINNESIISVSHIINEGFKNIPTNIKNNIIKKMCEYDKTDFYRLRVLKFNFDSIENDLRDNLILSLSSIDRINKPLSFIIRDKIHKISSTTLGESLINLLKGNYTKYTTYIARDYFYLLNEKHKKEILNKLLENYYYKNNTIHSLDELKTVLYIIIREYNQNNDKAFYNEILEKLSKNHNSIWGIVGCLIKNFDDLDFDIRNKLLINISEYPEVKDSIFHLIKYKNDKIPEEIKNILNKRLSIS